MQKFLKGSLLEWEDPKHTVFDSQSTNQIIAEIDFEANSETRFSSSTEEKTLQFKMLHQLNVSEYQIQSAQHVETSVMVFSQLVEIPHQAGGCSKFKIRLRFREAVKEIYKGFNWG